MSYNREELLEHFNKDKALQTGRHPRSTANQACWKSAADTVAPPRQTGALSTLGTPQGNQPREWVAPLKAC